nr:helix-turn-helix transcriptional regulator [Micromonospora sp. DSM 115978]
MDGGNRDRRMPFGAELRRRRLAAGVTLAELAGLVHYSKSYLSKVENGLKPPGLDLARRVDAVLGADGALVAGVGPAGSTPPRVAGPGADEVWMMTLGADGRHEFGRWAGPGRLSPLASWVATTAALPLAGDPALLASYRMIFDRIRALGQSVGPSDLVPVLISLTNSLRVMALRARPAAGDQMLVLASRFAEYTGWLAQEKGDEAAALWWTDLAVELATAGGDTEMASYAYVRRALVALYRHDAVETVALAQRAESGARSYRVRGLAAQRAAQGYAIGGDYDACRRALDRARSLLSRPDDDPDGPVLGTSSVADPVAVATGWCLYDLGRTRDAAGILREEVARIPPEAERARARFGARLALTLAGQREIEEACAVAEPVLAMLPRLDSATIRSDLRDLARTLNRWHRHSRVREIMPLLTAGLRTHVPAGLA